MKTTLCIHDQATTVHMNIHMFKVFIVSDNPAIPYGCRSRISQSLDLPYSDTVMNDVSIQSLQ